MDLSFNEILEIWENVKQSMIDNDTMPPSTCDLWFGDIEITKFTGDEITFASPSQSKYEIIAKKYVPIMEKELFEKPTFWLNETGGDWVERYKKFL